MTTIWKWGSRKPLSNNPLILKFKLYFNQVPRNPSILKIKLNQRNTYFTGKLVSQEKLIRWKNNYTGKHISQKKIGELKNLKCDIKLKKRDIEYISEETKL